MSEPALRKNLLTQFSIARCWNPQRDGTFSTRFS